MTFAQNCNEIFDQTVKLYHETDDVDAVFNNPFDGDTIEGRLSRKNWIDAVQWHLEDIIRDENIDPVEALALKRRIDHSNQDRTDLVEEIDTYFRQQYADVTVKDDATINTESPAWAIDRLSILALKIYHMGIEQRVDLTTAIDQLLDDIAAGRKYMKVYRQMKMYNDPETNPVLYGKK